MKNFFPLKFAVLLSSIYFLVPLFFILYLPNTTGWLVLKAFLALVMLGVFYSATTKYPEITLGAFICYLGLFFVLSWFFLGTIIGWLSSFAFLVLLWTKFRFIDKTEGEGMFSSKYDELKKSS